MGGTELEETTRRLGAAAGLLFVALTTFALFLPGRPPRASDSAAEIASSVAAHRSAFLLGTYLIGVAFLFGSWFFVVVRSWLAAAAPRRDQTYATVALVGGLFSLALTLLGFVLFYGIAFQTADAQDLAVVRGLADAGNSSFQLAKFGLATFVIFTSLAARRDAILPSWFTAAGLASGLLSIFGAIALFATGSATEIGSLFDNLTAVPASLWILLLALRMLRPRPALRASHAGPGL